MFHRKAHVVRPREALVWSVVWVVVALLFNAFVARQLGAERGLEFLTGYLIEKALSVDNLFVFLVLFSTFRVPAELQHKVLFWGIVGALLMRGAFVAAGAAALEAFHSLIYVFGGLLVLTGIKLLRQKDHGVEPARNPVYRLFQRVVPAVADYRGASFFVREGGRRLATPLFFVLVAVEATDLVFAVDSIPAIFAVTRDPFIVFTSNIFALLGLRALYFLLADGLARLRYLKVGLALVLVFVGLKMSVSEFVKVPIPLSLGVVTALLAGAVAASWWATRREAAQRAAGAGEATRESA